MNHNLTHLHCPDLTSDRRIHFVLNFWAHCLLRNLQTFCIIAGCTGSALFVLLRSGFFNYIARTVHRRCFVWLSRSRNYLFGLLNCAEPMVFTRTIRGIFEYYLVLSHRFLSNFSAIVWRANHQGSVSKKWALRMYILLMMASFV